MWSGEDASASTSALYFYFETDILLFNFSSDSYCYKNSPLAPSKNPSLKISDKILGPILLVILQREKKKKTLSLMGSLKIQISRLLCPQGKGKHCADGPRTVMPNKPSPFEINKKSGKSIFVRKNNLVYYQI